MCVHYFHSPSTSQCQSTNTAMEVVNTMHKVLTSDPANYFILDSLHSLPHLIEVLPAKSASVQVWSGVGCSEVVLWEWVGCGVGWGVVRWCCGSVQVWSGVRCSEVVLWECAGVEWGAV